ncbi:unnamed protein product, partial [Ectocarpus sp. 12 AP-2014]
GWSAKTTSTGSVYYENHATKTTTWDRPKAPAAAAPSHSGAPVGGASVGPYSSSGGGVGGVEEPLPPGWSEKTTSSGATYYENHATKTTTWERPVPAYAPAPAPVPPPQTAAPSPLPQYQQRVDSYGSTSSVSREEPRLPPPADAEPPLPPGWSQKMTNAGEVFYVNHNTKVTQWDRPPAPPQAAPRDPR